MVNDESGSLLAYSYSILNEYENYFYHLWNVHGVDDVR
jgi:hypothetical protein